MANAITAAALATEFVSVLKSWLEPVQFLQMRFRNARQENANICHSHDYCDANMAMLAAYSKLTGTPEDDVDIDDSVEIMGEAWTLASGGLGRGAQTLATTDDAYCMVDQLWWDTAQEAVVTQRMVDNHVSHESGVGIVVLQAKENANA